MSSAGGRGRRNQWALAVVLALLAVVVGYQVMGGSATRVVPSSNQATRADRREDGGAPPPGVRLDALGGDETSQPVPERNPFRFQPRAPARPAVPADGAAAPPAPSAPRPVPAAPRQVAAPIGLKFIGTVDAPGVGLIAALSDGTFVFHGREGEVIDGRYRIVTIGVESIVIERVDGGGRQTIRLTG